MNDFGKSMFQAFVMEEMIKRPYPNFLLRPVEIMDEEKIKRLISLNLHNNIKKNEEIIERLRYFGIDPEFPDLFLEFENSGFLGCIVKFINFDKEREEIKDKYTEQLYEIQGGKYFVIVTDSPECAVNLLDSYIYVNDLNRFLYNLNILENPKKFMGQVFGIEMKVMRMTENIVLVEETQESYDAWIDTILEE